MNTRRVAYWLVLLFAALFAAVATAEIYKSVDENGNVVFSQKAPTDAKSEVIKPRFSKPPTPPAGGGPPIPPNQPGALPSATATSAPPALTPEQLAAKQKNCDTARSQLQQLQNPRVNRMQYKNEKQELAFLTPDLIEARTQQAQDMVEKNCAAEGTAPSPAP